jgi:hypothetical protein
MIERYGGLILLLQENFTDILADAPPVSEFEDGMVESLKDFNRSMWPDMQGDRLDYIIKVVEVLPLSGTQKKIDRIREYARQCAERHTSTFTAADRLPSRGDDEMAFDTEVVDEIDSQIYDGPRRKLAFELRALRQHVLDELEEFRFLLLSDQDAALFQSEEPLFGDDVFARFSVANDDIAEAGKCIALGRGTAAVFHLMRVMEAGLKALGKELGIPYAPSWESYTKQIDNILDPAKYKSMPADKLAKRPFYEEVLGDVVAVKRAWRNPTMHIVKSYDVQQAKVIFEAVKSFMQHLAKELSADPSLVISTGQDAS